MNTTEKLRFLRVLNALSQEEMADLAGSSRIFYAAIEAGRKKLPGPMAETLGKALFVNDKWLMDADTVPFAGPYFQLVEFPPRRLLAPTRNAQQRRLSDARTAVESLMPLFLAENKLDKYFIAKASDSRKLYLLKFSGDQYLLFCVKEDKGMAASVEKSLEAVEGLVSRRKNIAHRLFDNVYSGYTTSVMRLLQHCEVDEAKLVEMKATLESVGEAKHKQTDKLDKQAWDALIGRICKEMADNNIPLYEIADTLREWKRYDLLETTSH